MRDSSPLSRNFLTASPEIFDLAPHAEDDDGDAYARCVLTMAVAGVARSLPESQLLHRLRDHIVPWRISGLDDTERAREIEEASGIVSPIIDQLRGIYYQRHRQM